MLLIDNILIHDEVVAAQFACNLQACKGACCVEGDGGAPLTPAEAELLPSLLPALKPYLTPAGKAAIEEQGAWVEAIDGELETPLIGNGGPCAYLTQQNGINVCGIELAWRDGKVDFQKPISCHLYPIRVDRRDLYEVLRYDRWDICAGGCTRGEAEQIPLYQFVKDALVRRFGADFYEQLDALVQHRQQTTR